MSMVSKTVATIDFQAALLFWWPHLNAIIDANNNNINFIQVKIWWYFITDKVEHFLLVAESVDV